MPLARDAIPKEMPNEELTDADVQSIQKRAPDAVASRPFLYRLYIRCF